MSKKFKQTMEYVIPDVMVVDLCPEGLLCQSLEDVLNEGYEYNNFGEW